MIKQNTIPKILIAGVGNELRQDDAFGLLAVRALSDNSLPPNVHVYEFGIGGIHLVQELHNQYDILIILDAVSWGGQPGEIFFRSATTDDINELPTKEKRSFLADMHYATPVRALMLAKAVNVLPKEVYILGCEAKLTEEFEMGISEEVKLAIPKAIEKLNQWLNAKTEILKYQEQS
jgi:hydrogenase maturation protease